MANETISLTPTGAAAMFKALGDPTRLRIFECLRCCDAAIDENGDVRPAEGATVGEVCCTVTGGGGITSTLSHHIRELRLAGLVDVERHGRRMFCRVNRSAVAGLGAWLTGAETAQPCCAAGEDRDGACCS